LLGFDLFTAPASRLGCVFEHWKEESTMSQPADQPVQQALEFPKDVSSDYETERKAFVRERALRDEISQLASARRAGFQEGLEEARQKGFQIGLQKAITKMVQSGISEARARAILGL
jgi:flagellar biosynthesis/type III secretory pathway protein FliH